MSALSLFEMRFHFHGGGSLIGSDDGGVKFIVFLISTFILQKFCFRFMHMYNKN
nr:MAG TPA: hypothetical protein [Caudoviricetes sp.]